MYLFPLSVFKLKNDIKGVFNVHYWSFALKPLFSLSSSSSIMVQEGNYKVKSLSPAVSAFQFQVKTPSTSSLVGSGQGDGTLKISTTTNSSSSSSSSGTSTSNTEDYFNNNKSYQSSPSTPTISGKEGYVYKDQLIILDEETRLRLTHMGQLPLDAEWTFWYDK